MKLPMNQATNSTIQAMRNFLFMDSGKAPPPQARAADAEHTPPLTDRKPADMPSPAEKKQNDEAACEESRHRGRPDCRHPSHRLWKRPHDRDRDDARRTSHVAARRKAGRGVLQRR